MIDCPACDGEGRQAAKNCKTCNGWGFVYLYANRCAACCDPRDRVIFDGRSRPTSKPCGVCKDERWIVELVPYDGEPLRVQVAEFQRVRMVLERKEYVYIDGHPDGFLAGIVAGMLLNLYEHELLGSEAGKQLEALKEGELVFAPYEVWHITDDEGIVLVSFK